MQKGGKHVSARAPLYYACVWLYNIYVYLYIYFIYMQLYIDWRRIRSQCNNATNPDQVS